MSSIPPLNYIMEEEAARVATRNFSFVLQKAFKEYKKVWNIYLDLIKKCEEHNSKSLSRDKIEITRQKDANYEYTENMRLDEEDMSNSIHIMEDILPQCSLDLSFNVEESNEGTLSGRIREDVSKSPVFSRNGSLKTSFKSSMVDSGLSNDNEQENVDQTTSAISANSMTPVPSTIFCSTPIKSKKWSSSKKQGIKKSTRSKIATPSSGLKKRNNLINVKKTNKAPLQTLNNANSILKSTFQIDKTNSNKLYEVQVTMTPNNRKLKQTKLVFHKTKKTVELSNNLKSVDSSQTATTGNFKESTSTDSINLREREDSAENNFIHICANTQIKNELILQVENEQTDAIKVKDPLNTSTESDSTFFSENDCDTSLNDNPHDYNKTSLSSKENEFESRNECFRKKHINSPRTMKNIAENIGTEKPIQKKRLSILENENCDRCVRCGKEHCSYHRSVFFKRKNKATSSCNALLPDSPSSTT